MTSILEGKLYDGSFGVKCRQTSDGKGLYADEGFSHPEIGTTKDTD